MDRTPSFGGQGDESYTHPGLGDHGGTGRRLMEMPAGTHRDQTPMSCRGKSWRSNCRKRSLLFISRVRRNRSKNKQTECNLVAVITEREKPTAPGSEYE